MIEIEIVVATLVSYRDLLDMLKGEVDLDL